MISNTVISQRQALPLDAKVALSRNRIIEWSAVHGGNIAVSFSGGKDSRVLLHLVRDTLGNIPAVFCNTWLEYPGIVQVIKKILNATILFPRKTFKEIILKYGYPVVSKEVARKIYEVRNTKLEELRNKRQKWLN